MSLAAGKAELSKCPHVSEEAKAKLSEAAAPPILPRPSGRGTGPEDRRGTVMFRHEKRFENPPGIALLISDTMADAEVDARLKKAKGMVYERVGLSLSSSLVALKAESGDAAKFAALAAKAKAGDVNIILMSENPDVLSAGLKACAEKKPLLYAATKDNADAVAALAKENGCAVAAKAAGLEELAALTEKLAAAGLKSIVMDAGARTPRQALEDQIVIRSAALNKKYRPLGYPTIVVPCEMTDDPRKEARLAPLFTGKYAGIIVLSDFRGGKPLSRCWWRGSISTPNPQRPSRPSRASTKSTTPPRDSPLLVTSNFSLTYSSSPAKSRNSKVPSWLYVKDTEGLSVMTSGRGKFSARISSAGDN
jgi:acetyl-CoA decarbonylase/synthase complex subunit gamma